MAKEANSATAANADEQANNEGANVSLATTETTEPKRKRKASKPAAKKSAKAKAKKAKKSTKAKAAKPRKATVKANGIVAEFHMHAEGPRADLIQALGRTLGKLHTSDALAKHVGDDKARLSHVMAMLAKKAQRYKLPYKVVKEEGKYGLAAK